MKKFLGKEIIIMLFSPKEKGQGLVEYALILVLIAIVVIVAMGALGNTVNGTFDSVDDTLSAGTT